MCDDSTEGSAPVADPMGAALDPIRSEACTWVARCLGKGLVPKDIEALKRWYNSSPAHAAAYGEIHRVWQTLGPAARAAMREESLRRGGRVAQATRPACNRRVFLGGGLAAAAASAAYLVVRPPLSLWPSGAELMADYRTQAGEQRKVALDEAISLDLNSKTSVAIRSAAAGTRKIELLSGEVAISMRAGSPVLAVLAGPVRTVASAADFNIRCDEGQGAVSCLKGSMRIEGMDPAVSLAAHQGIAFGDHRLGVIADIDSDVVTAWQRGLLVFDAVPVADILEEINRYRNGRIVLMNRELGRRRMTARLRIAETETVVLQIEQIFGAKATKLPGGITLLA